MDDMAQRILAVLERPTGIGIFSTSVEIPGKGRTRYWFSLASGMASLQAKIEYRRRFMTLPEWVSLCHPDHQVGLCRLAIGGNRPLPPAPPVAAAPTAGA
jgi:hypothetical protein